FNGHTDQVWSVEYSPFVINNIGNSNVICSGSSDNTIQFWDIRSNKNELYMIKGYDGDSGIRCLKFIKFKKKDKANDFTYDLNLCYELKDVFHFTLLFKKFEKLRSMSFKKLKSIINENCIKYQNKLQDILSTNFLDCFCIVSSTQKRMVLSCDEEQVIF
ncbi:hypothetical protein RFI_32561, partial [Reticulomyxa filosa]